MTNFRGMPILKSDGRALLCYSQFDMGNKYKIYCKQESEHYQFSISFDSVTKASEYFNHMNKQ
jgi:hypothetical protein